MKAGRSRVLALLSPALLAMLGGSGLNAQLNIAGVPCASPPTLHCPDANCPADLIMNPGNAVAPKSRRAFFLDYPCDLAPNEPVTFVLSSHGGGMTGNWQRHYFPLVDLKDEYRLVIASPSAIKVLWAAENDDAHLQRVISFVYSAFGEKHIKAFWIAGHSHGGETAVRLATTPSYREKVTGVVSLSSGRFGSKRAYAPMGRSSNHLLPFPASSPQASIARVAEDTNPGVGLVDFASLPDYPLSHIYTSGEFELTAAGLPKHSAWAQKLGCKAQSRGPDEIDRKAGYVWDSRSPKTRNTIFGRMPKPGRAQVYRYPDCSDGRVVADVIRLDKGHTEGLEPNATEEIVKLMVSAK